MADHLAAFQRPASGTVDAIDAKGAEAAAAEQFKLDAFQSRRLLVQELRRGALNGVTHHARRGHAALK